MNYENEYSQLYNMAIKREMLVIDGMLQDKPSQLFFIDHDGVIRKIRFLRAMGQYEHFVEPRNTESRTGVTTPSKDLIKPLLLTMIDLINHRVPPADDFILLHFEYRCKQEWKNLYIVLGEMSKKTFKSYKEARAKIDLDKSIKSSTFTS